MPCRRVRTFSPPMFIQPMRKNLTCSSGSPFSFSITCHAFGPWIWNRHSLRVTALPYGRDGDRGSRTRSTL
jgi:hypothetical protein